MEKATESQSHPELSWALKRPNLVVFDHGAPLDFVFYFLVYVCMVSEKPRKVAERKKSSLSAS